MSYRVFQLDLTNASTDDNKVEIVPHNQRITEVVILNMPSGVSIRLGFGDSQLFTVSGPVSFEPTGEDEQQHGLYWANPIAIPGQKIELIVASGSLGVVAA